VEVRRSLTKETPQSRGRGKKRKNRTKEKKKGVDLGQIFLSRRIWTAVGEESGEKRPYKQKGKRAKKGNEQNTSNRNSVYNAAIIKTGKKKRSRVKGRRKSYRKNRNEKTGPG